MIWLKVSVSVPDLFPFLISCFKIVAFRFFLTVVWEWAGTSIGPLLDKRLGLSEDY